MPQKTDRPNKPVKNLYVIWLDPAVLELKRFRNENPGYRQGKPCSYVGVTSHPPEIRFKQHIDGIKASRIVTRFGKRLQWKQFKRLNPIPAAEAEKRERALAEKLRRKGWGVWQK
ncbi:hypothetical protein [Candidatus Palauibacter sp.]|uniref:hypothetical protein n=1 Tax=Candidatus Palauibacter sp. TaxID=3101350 RepID=UPI003B01529C